MSGQNVWDNGIWALVKDVKFDFMTLYIMEHILSSAVLEGKTLLELGSGTGRLSYLALKHGASKVVLVDSSEKAITLSRNLFASEQPGKYEIHQANILDFSAQHKFDIVISSGVIEHFKGEDRYRIIAAHLNNAKGCCVIIHPTKTLYSSFFNNFIISKKLYGYQESFSDQEMDSIIRAERVNCHAHHSRFHLFYTVPLLHNKEWLNRSIDKTAIGSGYGGLTLTCIRMPNSETDAVEKCERFLS